LVAPLIVAVQPELEYHWYVMVPVPPETLEVRVCVWPEAMVGFCGLTDTVSAGLIVFVPALSMTSAHFSNEYRPAEVCMVFTDSHALFELYVAVFAGYIWDEVVRTPL